MWPRCQLTEYEKRFVSLYGEDGKPAVARRSYRLQLASAAQPARGIPAIKLIDQTQISRRARIFGITFGGNTDRFHLQVRNTNGLRYTEPAPRSQRYPVVSSIIAGSYYNALATSGVPPDPFVLGTIGKGVGDMPNFAPGQMNGVQSRPWFIEPNWVCQPNESLIFQVDPISVAWSIAPLGPDQDPEDVVEVFPAVLNIVVFAWEFPGMGA